MFKGLDDRDVGVLQLSVFTNQCYPDLMAVRVISVGGEREQVYDLCNTCTCTRTITLNTSSCLLRFKKLNLIHTVTCVFQVKKFTHHSKTNLHQDYIHPTNTPCIAPPLIAHIHVPLCQVSPLVKVM